MKQSFMPWNTVSYSLNTPFLCTLNRVRKMEEPKCEKCGSKYGYIRRNKENLNLKEWYCRKCGHTTILRGEKND